MKRIFSIRCRSAIAGAVLSAFLVSSMLVMPATPAGASEDEGVLRVAVMSDLPDFNIFNLGTNSVWKTKMVSWAFEGLAGVDRDGLPYPLLAQSWELDEGTLTVSLTVRQGVLFHDGAEMTADDVVFTYGALRAGTVYSPYIVAAFDQNADGALTAEEMAYAIQKTGTNSVVMRLSNIYPSFFVRTLTVPIIPSHIWSEHVWADGTVDSLWSEPEALTGTGSFAYGGGVPDEYRVMVKNDLYWGADFLTPMGYRTSPPNVEQLYFEVSGDLDTAILALQSDQVDHIAWPVPASALPAIEDDPSIDVEYMADNGYFYLAFNEKLDPFGSLPFRKAVAHLVDKATIVDDYLGGLGVAGNACLPPYWGDWSNDDVEPYAYDDPYDDSSMVPEQLLDAAGFVDMDGDGWRDLPDGRHMDAISILTPPADYDPVRYNSGLMVAENMRAVGIDASVSPVDFTTLVERVEGMTYQMLVLGWHLGADPISNVFDILGPLSATNTFGFWSLENPNPYYSDLLGVCTLADAETQALADQVIELGQMAASTMLVADQKAYTREAQAVIHDAVPVDVLYYRVNAEATRTTWTGWVPYLGSLLNMFSLSQLERDIGMPLDGSLTLAKGQGLPADSAVQLILDPTVDGTWTGVVLNDGLKGLEVEVFDTSSGDAVSVLETKLSLGSQPTGTFELGPVTMVAGGSYLFVFTPLGPEGGCATVTWYYTPMDSATEESGQADILRR